MVFFNNITFDERICITSDRLLLNLDPNKEKYIKLWNSYSKNKLVKIRFDLITDYECFIKKGTFNEIIKYFSVTKVVNVYYYGKKNI